MTSDEVFALLEEVGQENSSLEKTNIIKRAYAKFKGFPESTDWLTLSLSWAYDHSIVFQVGPVILEELENYEKSLPSKILKDQFGKSTLELVAALTTQAVTGNAAKVLIKAELAKLNPKSRQLLIRVISKDLRAGVASGIINNAIPGLIPDTPYMRCSLSSKVDLQKWISQEEYVIGQPKADGMFLNVDVHEVETEIYAKAYSRGGIDFPLENFPALLKEVLLVIPKNSEAHGELRVKDPSGEILSRSTGNGLLGSCHAGGALPEGYSLFLTLWDIIPLESAVRKGQCKIPYESRLKVLEKSFSQVKNLRHLSLIPSVKLRTLEEILKFYREQRKAGEEGAVICKRTGIWKDSDSAQEKVKFKQEVIVDLLAVKLTPGQGKLRDTFGSILCKSKCGELVCSVSGIADDLRLKISQEPSIVLGSIVAVKANDLTSPTRKDGKGKWSLYLPRLEEIRTDKKVADTLKEIQDQFESCTEV